MLCRISGGRDVRVLISLSRTGASILWEVRMSDGENKGEAG